MAMLGKEIRMSRLVNPVSNKMMAITVDHATSRGIAPMTGIQDVQSAMTKFILGKPDADNDKGNCRSAACTSTRERFLF